mmetsp:Transcript_39813/g.94413  ORF Transcript_39813/g.94413 Transcript_39813/m.94413 type:complete len:225 (+) Transcript_39813:3084-3758(+)
MSDPRFLGWNAGSVNPPSTASARRSAPWSCWWQRTPRRCGGRKGGNWPVKTSARVMPSLSSKSSVARTSPALTYISSLATWEMTPAWFACSCISIFITSISANGVPGCTCSPSLTRKRMSLPVVLARIVAGSFSFSNTTVFPSISRRSPVLSSSKKTVTVLPLTKTRRRPSLSVRASALTRLPLSASANCDLSVHVTVMQYFMLSRISSTLNSVHSSDDDGIRP